jgi:hypothetical protein
LRVVSILWLAAGCAGAKDDPPPPAGLVDEDGDGFTSAEDCDDQNANARPNADELWYDGIDADCAGDDDFDQDGDGHSASEFGGDDCVDANPAISPSQPETPYDGLDNDCDPLTPDDDLDGDGFVAAQDCEDNDAQQFPGGLEILGNTLDDDCSGEADSSPFVTGDLDWLGLSRPHLAQTDDWFVIVVSALQVSSPTYVPEPISSVAALLTLDPLGSSSSSLAVEPFLWKGEFDEDEVTSVDAGTYGGELTAATAYWSDVNRFGWMVVQPLSWEGPGVGWRQGTASYRSTPLVDYDQVDLAFDEEGTAWMCASDEDSVVYMRGDSVLASSGGEGAGDGTLGCLAEPASGGLQLTTISSTGDPLTWQSDLGSGPPVASAAQPYSDEHWRAVRERNGIITAVPYDRNGVVYFAEGQRHTLLDGTIIEDAEVALAPDGTVWVAAVASAGEEQEVLLAYGTAPALTELWLSPGEVGVPLGASLLVTDERVLLVTTSSDRVGWLLLGRPQ